jgi:hypothetical protein
MLGWTAGFGQNQTFVQLAILQTLLMNLPSSIDVSKKSRYRAKIGNFQRRLA